MPIVSNTKFTNAFGNPPNSSIQNPVSIDMHGLFTNLYASITLYFDMYFISSLLGSSNSYSNTLKFTSFNFLFADAIFPLLCVTNTISSIFIFLSFLLFPFH